MTTDRATPVRSRWPWTASLRFRLLAATIAALTVALLLSGWFLGDQFRIHVMRQFETALTQQLDQITAQLDFDATGQPVIDPESLSDPRWQKPYSGLYWQLDRVSARTPVELGILRSRSLWDTHLTPPDDVLSDGSIHVHPGTGPLNARVLMIERNLRTPEQPDVRWRLVVAADLHQTSEAVARFNGMLWLALLALGLLLALAALAQVAVGLAPLRAMQRALVGVREGRAQRLQGQFPVEMQPLIDDFNGVLDRNAAVVERARAHAGNLAHALKTPLAVMGQAAAQARTTEAVARDLPRLIEEQVERSRRHIDWHLARSRVAAAQRLPGTRTPVAPIVGGLLRVMQRVHAARGLQIDMDPMPSDWAFAGKEQDLQEMLGNLLDNACKWARSRVRIGVQRTGNRLDWVVEDDGPGIPVEQREAALARGGRLDESTPGSGLGLAIVTDLVELYGGSIALDARPDGGLLVRLSLPATA